MFNPLAGLEYSKVNTHRSHAGSSKSRGKNQDEPPALPAFYTLAVLPTFRSLMAEHSPPMSFVTGDSSDQRVVKATTAQAVFQELRCCFCPFQNNQNLWSFTWVCTRVSGRVFWHQQTTVHPPPQTPLTLLLSPLDSHPMKSHEIWLHKCRSWMRPLLLTSNRPSLHCKSASLTANYTLRPIWARGLWSKLSCLQQHCKQTLFCKTHFKLHWQTTGRQNRPGSIQA